MLTLEFLICLDVKVQLGTVIRPGILVGEFPGPFDSTATLVVTLLVL